MILWLAAMAALADPPSHEVLDDLDRWETGTDELLDGPPGCWEITAQVGQRIDVHQPPDRLSTARRSKASYQGPMTARLVDGRWHDLKAELTQVSGGKDKDLDIDVVPLIGVQGDDGDDGEVTVAIGDGETAASASAGSSVGLLRKALNEWGGSTETAFARWDDEARAVVYDREIPVADSDNRVIEVEVRFPEAGPHATRIDALWPRRMKVGSWPTRVTLRDAQMHVLGHVHDDAVLPWMESVSLAVGVLGYTLGYEQRIQYTSARPCSTSADEPAADHGEPAPE